MNVLDDVLKRVRELRFYGSTANVFDAALSVLPGSAAPLVKRCDATPIGADLEVLSSKSAIEVTGGDPIVAGYAIHIDHSGVVVSALHHRLRCRNDLRPSRPLRIAHQPADKHLREVREVARDIWAKVPGQLEALRRLPKTRAHVPAMLDDARRRAALPPSRRLNIFRAWRDEELAGTTPDSEWLVVNSLTRVSTHNADLPAREREALGRIATGLAFPDSGLWPSLTWRNHDFTLGVRAFVLAGLKPSCPLDR